MADENPIVVVEPDPGHKYHGNIDILTAMKNLAVKCGKAESADVIEAQTVADVWHLMGANDEAVTIAECIDSMEQSDFGGGGDEPNPNKLIVIPKQEFTVTDGLIDGEVAWPPFYTSRSFSGTPYAGGTSGIYMYSFTNLGALPDLGSSSPKSIAFTFDDEDISLPFCTFSGSAPVFGLFQNENVQNPIFTEECPIAVSVLPAGTLVVLLPDNSAHTIAGGFITVERNGVVWSDIPWESYDGERPLPAGGVVLLIDDKIWPYPLGTSGGSGIGVGSVTIKFLKDNNLLNFKVLNYNGEVSDGRDYDQVESDLVAGTHTIEMYWYINAIDPSTDMRTI